MEPSQDSIIQVKEDIMVSPLSCENPIHRTAYFIKPCMEDSADLPHFMFDASNQEKIPLVVRYNGWHYPHEDWKKWVKRMKQKYEHLWIEAGIDQAIKASTYQICRSDELILELAQRWCSKTNTFVFPWGEATITLEDMKVCWGYSVLGDPFYSPLESDEEKEIEQELLAVFRMFFSSKAKRADHTPWMKHFMNNESQVEHVGFLSLWLSRFVFPPKSCNAISKSIFPIAVHLARGSKLALAPAVLAGIYRDLSLLNNKIKTATNVDFGVTLWTPFQLVQVWALERFPLLHPMSLLGIGKGHVMVAKWHKVKMLKHYKLKLILDPLGARNGFIWCPYENSPPLKLCNEQDMWVFNNPSYYNELDSFDRCLRVSELVGMKCVEHYYPNRVAMQFGMDQDIPGMLRHCNENPWISYSQLVSDKKSYNAIRAWYASDSCHHPNVTSRYYHWWKQSYPSKEGDIHDCNCVLSSSEHLLPTLSYVEKEGGGSNGPPPDFTNSKFKREQEEDFYEAEIFSVISSGCFGDEEVGNGEALSSSLYVVSPSSRVEGASVNNGIKIKTSFSDNKGVSDKEGEDDNYPIVDIASNLESRIQKLERVIFKAAKNGH